MNVLRPDGTHYGTPTLIKYLKECGYCVSDAKKDRKRKRYHNYHCDGHWGDSRLYDLSINSSRLGLDRTVDLLEEYIKSRMGEE